jgi:hypothetical protein
MFKNKTNAAVGITGVPNIGPGLTKEEYLFTHVLSALVSRCDGSGYSRLPPAEAVEYAQRIINEVFERNQNEQK